MSAVPSASPRDTHDLPVALSGLTSQEAAARLSTYGPNDPTATRRSTFAPELLHLFLNPLVIILLVASVISALLGQKIEAEIIFVIVVFSVTIDFAQTYRSQRAIDRLQEHVSLTATALRDGRWQEISRREVVPGDLVRLSAGDLVPADGQLIEARDLYVQQAALTGESMPAEKDARAGEQTGTASPLAPDWVFLGTSVVSGSGVARLVATGTHTSFGAIAEKLADREETEFQRGLRRFGMLITRTVLFLVLFIVAVRIAMHKDAFESFVFAVALAVGLTPEFLPMITSVTLGRGAIRMAQDHVIVKHLPAIQNFGTIDVFCSDKTGTLTTGEMVLASSVDYLGRPSDHPLALAYVNSKFETGIRSPLEVAILKMERPEADAYVKCDEVPFDFERRRLSIVVQAKDGDNAAAGMLIVKGAPEGILELCTFYESEGRIAPLDPALKDRCRRTFDDLSRQGLRLLAVAYRNVDPRGRFSAADEHSLVLAGYLAFADPPSPDAAESIAALERDGVEVKILTGDNEFVACHVCEQVGIEHPVVMLGQEFDSTSDTALEHRAEETTVFARVTPMQKHRIIHALQRRGHVVGYMGDGINDAPSLHAADVGISVASAVDVARDAAEIILLRPGLSILHKGILEGRQASANVLKYLFMGTSSNFGNMFSMAAASVFLPFLPMLPTQILLNNFLYDASQLTIPSDNVDDESIRRPRPWDMKVVRNFMLLIGPISSIYDFLTFYVLLHFFHASQPEFHTGWFVESLATQTLVIFVIRTVGNPFKSRPSLPLAVTTILIVAAGIFLPYSPFSRLFGFVPLPAPFFVFLAISTGTYLVLVEFGKRMLLRDDSCRTRMG